jgi:hypothetical protein
MNFQLTFRFITLFPFETMLDLEIEGYAFGIRQDPSPIELVVDVICLSPLFSTSFQGFGDMSAFLTTTAVTTIF